MHKHVCPHDGLSWEHDGVGLGNDVVAHTCPNGHRVWLQSDRIAKYQDIPGISTGEYKPGSIAFKNRSAWIRFESLVNEMWEARTKGSTSGS